MLKNLVLICILSFSLATQYNNHILKESLENAPSQWLKVEDLNKDDLITLHIFVKQQNTEQLTEMLYAVSDPQSPSYGQHLTNEEVNELVAPKQESIDQVMEWLEYHNVDSIKSTPNSDIIEVEIDAETAELLLSTKFHKFQHEETNKIQTRALSYSLPEQVHSHIDFVGPCIRFPKYDLPKITSNGNVTPAGLRSLYKVGDAKSTSPNNSIAVASFLDEYFNSEDLQNFYKQFSSKDEGRKPIVVGDNIQSSPGAEAALDIEYLSAMGAGVEKTYFYYTDGQQPHNPGSEPFLKWLTLVANTTDAPLVFSISYGDDESGVQQAYYTRLGVEFQKAGVRGISLLASSGDSGVNCNSANNKFQPTWPAESPFITAVGATTGGISGDGSEHAATLSGGGFSNRDAPPSYQTSFISQYFTNAASTLPASNYYNASGAGFPDVSAQGENFVIILGGYNEWVSGTSCSSPTFAGIVGLLNDLRLQAGKSSLGWLNPLFYQHPEAFQDITSGSNPYTCTDKGFTAVEGWDPVTGLGTMDYSKWSSIIQSLNEQDDKQIYE